MMLTLQFLAALIVIAIIVDVARETPRQDEREQDTTSDGKNVQEFLSERKNPAARLH